MIIKWKDDYSCYDLTIDQQHKKLIDMINQMSEIVELNDGCDRYDEIIELFEELKSYTVYHFNHEEELFDQNQYDSFNIKIQKLEHKSFINKVSAINLREVDEDQIGAVRKILDFLSVWLDHHILVTDRKFGAFLQENAK
ncbi:MAG: bacteriohemerythrin [Clostridia bacterium]|nr:bacteriohemerythrin [Clostridia bacterium]